MLSPRQNGFLIIEFNRKRRHVHKHKDHVLANASIATSSKSYAAAPTYIMYIELLRPG